MPETGENAVGKGWILNDVSPVEGGTEDCGVSHLAAIAASHTAIVDMGDRRGPQRIARGFHGERRTAREADAGMIARARCFVHPVTGPDHALALLKPGILPGLFAALPRQHALAIGNDHAQALAAGENGAP